MDEQIMQNIQLDPDHFETIKAVQDSIESCSIHEMWLFPPSVGTGGNTLKPLKHHTSTQSCPNHQAAP